MNKPMNKECLYQIEKLLKMKERLTITRMASITFRGFTTNAQLTYDQARTGEFMPIHSGELWGEDWMYAWFLADIVIPEEAAGKRIVVFADFGSEATIYRNGKVSGAFDLQHDYVTLTRSGVSGETYELLAEAYAGHSGRLPRFGEAYAALFEEEVYQFYIDLECLYQVRIHIDSNSLRTAEIDRCLTKVVSTIDFSLTGEERINNLNRCRQLMEPLLACENGSTSPVLYLMGQSHLDIAWLWPMAETKRKIARTISNQLALIEEYPEYCYVQSQPYLFQLVKELYPELYARIKQAVKKGSIIPEGGMWVEPDTNLTSGESLIRQIIHGKRFFKDEFGIDNQMLWLPDVFGYSGNLPQIMRGCGLNYFASVKMFQTYDNVVDPFPYNTFMWEGIDGSQVLTHMLDYGDYPLKVNPSFLIKQWNERVQKDGIATRLVQFGHGDGGGGSNRDDMEFLLRMENLEGVPKTKRGSPIAYFEDQINRGIPDNKYVGELYYPAHRGTYTTQAQLKRLNREAEIGLHEAELWGAAASLFQSRVYPYETMDQLWKRMLLHQFHDILPGTSIQRVHEEAGKELASLNRDIRETTSKSLDILADGETSAMTVFNSLSWERKELIALPEGFTAIRDREGRSLPVQWMDGERLAEVSIPAAGWAAYELGEGSRAAHAAEDNTLVATQTQLENEYIIIRFNGVGEIQSIVDKESGAEWAAGNCNVMRMYRDNPSAFDAWEIDRRYAESSVELDQQAKVTVTAEGPLLASIRVERMLNNSTLIQDIKIRKGSRRVEFQTQIDWNEKNKMLRVDFPVHVYANESMQEIQFGYVKRPTHASRPHDADRFEVNQHKWSVLAETNRSFALLNDCKYGISIKDNTMSMTLLRSPSYPDETSDQGMQQFTYGFFVWNGSFFSSPVIQEAYELNYPALVSNKGSRMKELSLFNVDCRNIMIETVKLAEDGSGDWVIRLYEGKGTSTACKLTSALSIERFHETNMLEERQAEQQTQFHTPPEKIALYFRPFEVKTIRLNLKKKV